MTPPLWDGGRLVQAITVYGITGWEVSFGQCECGNEVKLSKYWMGPSINKWLAMWFKPNINKPLCNECRFKITS